MTLGEKIKYIRKKSNITQDDLHQQTGINLTTIKKYETNRVQPLPQQVERIASALDVSYVALNGIDNIGLRLETIGDLMGILIALIASNIICINGERDRNNLLIEASVSIFFNPSFSQYLQINVPSPDAISFFSENVQILIQDEKVLKNLIQWERLNYMCIQAHDIGVGLNKADLENDLIQYYLSETKGNLTFEECFNLWMESEEASANPGISPKSITNYRAEYKRFLEGHSFCSLMMADIKDSDLHNLLFDIVERPDKISRKRFNSVKSLLTKVFDYARMRLGMNVLYSRQILKEMVFKPNQFLITDKKQQIFYQKDLIPFLNYLAKQNTLISLGIAFTAQTGLRVSEIAAISWEDVHGHSIHICRAEHSWTESDGTRHVEIGLPKEYKFRDVILSDEVKALLTKIREIHPTQTGYLFLNNGVRATQNHYNYNPYLEDEQVAIFKGANIMLPPVSPQVP